MIKNIIFDIGNVLVTFDPKSYFKNYFDEVTNAFLCEEVFSSNTWVAVDQGLISELEAQNHFLKQLPTYEKELHILFDTWKGLMVEKAATLRLLKDLKSEGYKIFLLSNIGEDSYEYCLHKFQFVKLVDGGVYSYQEKIVKPDEKIYACLLNKYNLLPGECIFLDDAPKNIQQAQTMGIHAILFQDIQQVKERVYHTLKEENHVES